MKYKLKFEIIYPSNKGVARDMKIHNVLEEFNTEIESEYPIPIPSKEDIIILGGEEYLLKTIKHKLDTDTYTTIIEVESRSARLKMEEEIRKAEIESMMNTFSFK